METACNYTDKTMYISTDERWLINRLLEFKELYPEEVHIIKFPEDNDGCLYLRLPAKWLKITPPRKHEISEEQRDELRMRMQKMRNARKEKQTDNKEDA